MLSPLLHLNRKLEQPEIAIGRAGSLAVLNVIDENRDGCRVQLRSRFDRVWPQAFLAVALIITVAWIGALGYGFSDWCGNGHAP
jgi:hypothetical protein